MQIHSYTAHSPVKALLWQIHSLRRLLGELKRLPPLPHRGVLKNSRMLKNSRSGPAIVAATGPSLNSIPEELLLYFKNNDALFGVNHYLLTDKGQSVAPTYQVLIDDYHFTKKGSLDPVELEFRQQLKKVNIKYIVQRYSTMRLNDHSDQIFIFGHVLPGISRSINPLRVVGFVPNSSLFAISIALYLGFSPIYVTGLDYDYHKYIAFDGDTLVLKRHHSYESGMHSKPWLGRENIPDLLDSIAFAVDSMKLLAKSRDVFVIGSEGSVDAFPRLSLESLTSKYLK